MEQEIEYLLSLFTDNEIANQLPLEVLERERNWASGWLFSNDQINQKLLTSLEIDPTTKRMVIANQLERLKDNRMFWEALVQNKEERRLILDNGQNHTNPLNQTIRKNTLENSTINSNHTQIGDNKVKINIKFNEEKKPEIRCPYCNTLMPVEVREFAEKEGASFGIDCPSCKRRYYPISNLAGNVSLYKALSPRDSETFNHLINAVESDLKLGNAEKAYERCERLKEQYGKEGAVYEYCALTYFYATPINNIIHNSARFIFVYLDDAKQRNPNSETYNAIAATIAWGYAQRLKNLLDNERSRIPTKPKPTVAKPGKAELAAIDKSYRQAVTVWRSKLLRILDEYETAYRILPFDGFLQNGINELCGHNGTPWFNLRFNRLFFPPANLDIMGFVWDYYDLRSNMTDFNGNVDTRPEQLLSNWYQKVRQNQLDYAMPDILIGGETAIGAVTIKSRLVRNGWIFWGIAFALFLLGLLIGNTYTMLFSAVLFIGALIKFREVKNSLLNLFSHI